MAFLAPFEYDIFISYARVNDLPWPGTDTGWVTHFKRCLSTALTQEFGRDNIVAVWHDRDRIGGGMHFDDAIKEGINKSAVFLALFSNGYVAEECYCTKELDLFHGKAQKDGYGLRVGHYDRIWNLRLQQIEFDQWPEALAGREGYKFHRDDLPGRPPPPGPLFDAQFERMFADLVHMLRAFKTVVAQKQNEARQAETPGAGSQTVFMAHVKGSLLRKERRRAIDELKRTGVNVRTGVPPPSEFAEHERRVSEELTDADLSVHMLEEDPGGEIDGAPDKFFYREQVEIGKRLGKRQLIRVPKTLEVEAVEDPAHREFLSGLEAEAAGGALKLVREAPTRIAAEILAELEMLKRQPAAASAAAQAPGQSVALLDIHPGDSKFAMELSPVFLEERVELRIRPEGDGPRDNVSQFEGSFRQARVLVIIFGRVAAEWVCQRIVSVQQFFVKQQCPLRFCGVYIPPPAPLHAPLRRALYHHARPLGLRLHRPAEGRAE
jgi:hypothetical protein